MLLTGLASAMAVQTWEGRAIRHVASIFFHDLNNPSRPETCVTDLIFIFTWYEDRHEYVVY